MKILITGTAGFIGNALALALLARGDEIVGIDNHNLYYDPLLKSARLQRIIDFKNYTHLRIDIADKEAVDKCFREFQPQGVINLAAQAGVRYSIENPYIYVESNVVGFINILQASAINKINHLVYASSSSVYGANTTIPFSEHHNVDHPLSIYAATKKANELMAHSYSHIYNLPTTGLRFFTVYGPWGRPDMALFKFTQQILNDQPIAVYNYGEHLRDFTFIDDIVAGIICVFDKPATANINWNGTHPDPASSSAPWRIYNIGNHQPVKLLDYINTLENALGKKAQKQMLPIQAGDLPDTFADVNELINNFQYQPQTNIKDGVEKFVKWYRDFYKV